MYPESISKGILLTEFLFHKYVVWGWGGCPFAVSSFLGLLLNFLQNNSLFSRVKCPLVSPCFWSLPLTLCVVFLIFFIFREFIIIIDKSGNLVQTILFVVNFQIILFCSLLDYRVRRTNSRIWSFEEPFRTLFNLHLMHQNPLITHHFLNHLRSFFSHFFFFFF